jgi:DNA-binding FadR family transcriptional regulator
MAYGPSPIKRDSVISQAAQEICRIIEAERLAPGDTLPPETRLSQMLGISRNSVREALRVLHGLGYVEKAAGRRVVVTAGAQGGKSMFDESVLLEAAPIANQVRSHIAQKCAELSAERMTAAE